MANNKKQLEDVISYIPVIGRLIEVLGRHKLVTSLIAITIIVIVVVRFGSPLMASLRSAAVLAHSSSRAWSTVCFVVPLQPNVAGFDVRVAHPEKTTNEMIDAAINLDCDITIIESLGPDDKRDFNRRGQVRRGSK